MPPFLAAIPSPEMASSLQTAYRQGQCLGYWLHPSHLSSVIMYFIVISTPQLSSLCFYWRCQSILAFGGRPNRYRGQTR
jgi:hypothetical protein